MNDVCESLVRDDDLSMSIGPLIPSMTCPTAPLICSPIPTRNVTVIR
jgi:hypothetical protein